MQKNMGDKHTLVHWKNYTYNTEGILDAIGDNESVQKYVDTLNRTYYSFLESGTTPLIYYWITEERG